jgi:uncharacterized membrane protein
MEIFLIIVVGLTLIFMLISFRQEVKKNMRVMNKNIINVRKEVSQVREKINDSAVVTTVNEKSTQQPNATESKPEKRPPNVSPIKSESKAEPFIAEEQKEKVSEKQEEKSTKKEAAEATPVKEEQKAPAAAKPVLQTERKSRPAVEASKERTAAISAKSHPPKEKKKRDYEKIIGENWLNKIGIAILVIGIGFFVKYAIDQNWIGEVGRVAIGIGTGGLLMGIAHYLRKKYRAFSSVLIGGGISVLYYTISIAYHDYTLFSQPVAFAIMTGITLLSTVMAVLYDRKELAIIGLIGGFTSPFMVQGETGNYVAFFTYIAILNTGMLLLSFFKKWQIVSQLALGFTIIFFGTWMVMENMYDPRKGFYAIVFSTIFFIQFLGANLTHNLIRKLRFNAWEFVQLSSITAFYYGGMMYLLNVVYISITPSMFTLILSGFFTALTFISFAVKGTDKTLIHLLTGKAIAFTTLTGALIFEGNHMTEYWIIESVVLLIVGLRGKMKILTTTSFILIILASIGLIRDWAVVYGDSLTLVPFWNNIFATGIIYIVGVMISFVVISRVESDKYLVLPKTDYSTILGSLLFGSIYFVFLLEIHYQMENLFFESGKHLVLWMYHFGLILLAQFIARFRKSALFQMIMFVITCTAVIAYLVFGQYNNYQILKHVSTLNDQAPFYWLHFALVIGVLISLFITREFSKKIIPLTKNRHYFYAAIWVVGLVIATNELDQILGYAYAGSFGLSKVLSHTQAEGYTVLWGIYSFIVMITGMKRKNRIMRILALILFAVTLFKLFALDIRNISEAGKIIAFISLGVLLLVISFMYQKLKQLIIGDEESAAATIENEVSNNVD